jgi:hypothetical protein
MGACSHDPISVDDKVACTKDACDSKAGVTHVPDDTACKAGEHCDAVAGCTTKLLNPVITEIQPLGQSGNHGELVEIYNPGDVDAEITGYTLTAKAGKAALHAASDPTGSSPIVVKAKSFVYGIPSPAKKSDIPASAGFVYGDPNTDWELADAGDVLAITDEKAAVLDAVDFTKIATTTALPGDFPASLGASMQLDKAALDAKANDVGDNWCLTFRAADTAGSANHACGNAMVVNEVLSVYVLPTGGMTSNQNAFIEIAGPGGATIKDYRVQSFTGKNQGSLYLTIGTGPKAPLRLPLDGLLVIADGDVDDGTTNVPNADIVVGNAIPPSASNSGQSIQLADPTSTVLDSLGYGASPKAEGSPVSEILPDKIAISMARDATSSDTDSNAADFHYDPTPTPGLPNDIVAPKVYGYAPYSPMDTPSLSSTTVFLLAHDYADFKSKDGVAIAGNDVTASFVGNGMVDTSSTTDGCTIVDATDGGRGDVTIKCTAPTNAGLAARGDIVLDNAAFFGGTSSLKNAWVYTLANNASAAPAEADLCSFVAPMGMLNVQQGLSTPSLLGHVMEPGVTTNSGANAAVIAQVGLGKQATDPTKTGNWIYFDSQFDADFDATTDQYKTTFVAPPVLVATPYSLVYRFSFDGGLTFTYCDLLGDGSAQMTKLTTAQLPTLTVTP